MLKQDWKRKNNNKKYVSKHTNNKAFISTPPFFSPFKREKREKRKEKKKKKRTASSPVHMFFIREKVILAVVLYAWSTPALMSKQPFLPP